MRRMLLVTFMILSIVGTDTLVGAADAEVKYEANWKSLDTRPMPEWYPNAKFGIFIHWGTFSVPAWGAKHTYAEWYWQRTFNADGSIKDNEWGAFHKKNYGEDFPYENFAQMFKAEMFNPDEWAEIFKNSGAKYVVLTSKHHEGYTLWPSKEANKTWGRKWNSVDIGPHRDLLGDLTKSVRDKGLKMGFYYSLYEWFNPLWRTDRAKYVDEHMIPQFKDVVTNYKPSIIFSDGEWDMPAKDWKSEELLAWLYNESPCKDDVVVNDRWGKGVRHNHGDYFTTEYGAGMADGKNFWEENRGMGFSYGFNRNEPLGDYRSSREMVLILVDLVSRGGNLLLNVGPTADGRIPVVMQERLAALGDWLRVNGEAIYDTRPWKNVCQWTDGKQPSQEYTEFKAKYNVLDVIGQTKRDDGRAVKQIFFTAGEDALYAITPGWPGRQLVVRGVKAGSNTKATMLGVDGDLKWVEKDGNLVVTTPDLGPGEAPCQFAYTFKLTDLK